MYNIPLFHYQLTVRKSKKVEIRKQNPDLDLGGTLGCWKGLTGITSGPSSFSSYVVHVVNGMLRELNGMVTKALGYGNDMI